MIADTATNVRLIAPGPARTCTSCSPPPCTAPAPVSAVAGSVDSVLTIALACSPSDVPDRRAVLRRVVVRSDDVPTRYRAAQPGALERGRADGDAGVLRARHRGLPPARPRPRLDRRSA